MANIQSLRPYQQAARDSIHAQWEQGRLRTLLVLPTGTGKTYTAFQIVYRLLKSGMKRKVLYLADRNILVDQSIQQDFAPLEKVTHKINVAKDDPSRCTSPSTSNWWETTIRSTSANCSPRTSLT